ncbi:hypothetical protein D3C81_1619630 [compost metagenome]
MLLVQGDAFLRIKRIGQGGIAQHAFRPIHSTHTDDAVEPDVYLVEQFEHRCQI